MTPTENFCTEHFYVKETLKDVRKEQFRFRKDMTQIKFILIVLLVNAFGVTDAVMRFIL